AVEMECRVSADDDVHLLVTQLLLGVLLDDLSARARRGVRVHPEGGETEAPPDRAPFEPALPDRNPVEVVEPGDLVTLAHALAFRRASSTTGSMRSIPSTRSSRFSFPAQSLNARARSPSKPSFPSRDRSSSASSASTSTQSSSGVTPNSS